MVARRRFVEFEMSEADRAALQGIARSRSEKAGRVLRAGSVRRKLLDRRMHVS
jgi:hypothetical protein